MLAIAFVSASGGAGKTTLAINTAASLVIKDNKKVLFVDLDPSAMATRVLLGRTYDDCNLKTLMKELVMFKKGYLRKEPTISQCLHRHIIPGNNAVIHVLPGGNLDEISNDIKNVSQWGLLLKELIDKLMDEINYSFDAIILDSPNWVYQFFEMTFPLAPLYVAITRPGIQEVKKFIDFLEIVVNMLHNQNVFIPGSKDYESLIAYVVNQYRSDLHGESIMNKWREVDEQVRRKYPNIRALINDKPDYYYGTEKTKFVGFKHVDGMSLDLYTEDGPLCTRKISSRNEGKNDNKARPVKQFLAYYEALKQFITEVAPVEVAH